MFFSSLKTPLFKFMIKIKNRRSITEAKGVLTREETEMKVLQAQTAK